MRWGWPGLLGIAERANASDNLRGRFRFYCMEFGVIVVLKLKAILQFLFAGIFAFMLLCIGKVYEALFAPLVALIVVDLVMRWSAAGEYERPFFNLDAGGHFGFIPLWFAAIVWIAIFGFYCLKPQ